MALKDLKSERATLQKLNDGDAKKSKKLAQADKEHQKAIQSLREAERLLSKKLQKEVVSLEERILDERRTQNRKLQASLEQLDEKPRVNSLAQSFSKVYEPLEGKLTELRQLFNNETAERQTQFEKLQRQLNWKHLQAKDIELSKDTKASVLNLESPNPDLEVSGDGMLVPLTSAGFAAVKALRNHQ